MENKTHFLHQTREKGKERRRKQACDGKRECCQNLTKQPQPGGHAWITKGQSAQCQQRKKRLTARSKMEDLQQGQRPCPMASQPTFKGGSESTPDSKASILKHMVDGTLAGMEPVMAKCWNEEWKASPDWQGHPTHRLWRKGGRVFCQQRKSYAIVTSTTNRPRCPNASSPRRQIAQHRKGA